MALGEVHSAVAHRTTRNGSVRCRPQDDLNNTQIPRRTWFMNQLWFFLDFYTFWQRCACRQLSDPSRLGPLAFTTSWSVRKESEFEYNCRSLIPNPGFAYFGTQPDHPRGDIFVPSLSRDNIDAIELCGQEMLLCSFVFIFYLLSLQGTCMIQRQSQWNSENNGSNFDLWSHQSCYRCSPQQHYRTSDDVYS